jgi:O-antigen/teichoic acid export membrane protein
MTIDSRSEGRSAHVETPSGGTGFVSRVLRGSGAMALGAISAIGTQLLVVPAAIWAWGPAKYGEWIVVSGAITVFQLADLGLQTYVVNSICTAFARGNLEEFHATLRDALAVQIRIVGALIAAVWLVLWFSPVEQWLNLHTVDRRTVIVALGILSFDLLLSVPVGVIAGVYRATVRFPRNVITGVVQKVGMLALAIALLYLRRGFISLAVAKLCVTFCGIAWLMFDFPRLYPWLKIRIAGADLRRGFDMLAPGLLFLLYPAADYATNQISLLIAQHQRSGLDVALLSTHRTIFNSAQMAANFVLLSVWPELTVLYAREDREKMRRVHETLTKINCFVVLFVIGGVLLAGQWLYPIWTRKSMHFDGVLAGLLAAETLCWGYWSVSSMVLMSINRPASIARAAAFNGALATILAFALIPRMGIRGAAVGSLIADLSVYGWFLPRCAAWMTGGTYRAFLLGPTRKAALAIMIPVLFLCLAITQQNASVLVRLGAVLSALGAMAIGVRLAFDESERVAFGSLFRRFLAPGRPNPAVAAMGGTE